MDSSDNRTSKCSSKNVNTLRRPIHIVKKRSGPLDEVLAKLNKSESETVTVNTKNYEDTTTDDVAVNNVPPLKSANVTRPSPTSTRRRLTLKDKEKKRERWLLTRKTWKYMTDAGRKLIPDGAQNRHGDIPKIEAHFQKVCAAEPHFILWRRKASYPGAMRNSKKRLKQLLQHTGQKSQHVIEQEEIYNADLLLELLHSFLKLDEAIKTDTLLGTKTEGPHQTNSPSAQRPKPLTRNIRRRDAKNMPLREPGFLPPPLSQTQDLSEEDQLLQRLLALSRSTTLSDILNVQPEKINPELLNDKVTLKKIYNALKKQQLHRILNKHSMPSKPRTNLTHSSSMLSLLHFGSSHPKTKTATTPINLSNEDKFIKTKSPTTTSTISIPASISSSYLSVPHSTKILAHPTAPQRTRKPPSSLNLSGGSDTPYSMRKYQHRQTLQENQLNSCGTQTNFIPLSEIKRLAEDYKEYKRKELAGEAGVSGNNTTDDEGEKHGANNAYRRKSSIDNEDVSQSVSDTIKRYLRMARKKSVHDDNINRFKRVNYDRNLRNIQAKGEINPPGMDEDNNKAVQTLDAWALITLDFIRGNENSGILEIAHNDWKKALEERIQRKLVYERKTNQNEIENKSRANVHQSTSSCSSSSAPTSPTSMQSPTHDRRPTVGQINVDVGCNIVAANAMNETNSNMSGIFYSGSQFIANLWHGTTTSSSNSSSPTSVVNTTVNVNHEKHDQLSTPSNNNDIGSNNASSNSAEMQKSKSLSHIGQYVSTKLLKPHTKNQTKPNDPIPLNLSNTPKWSKTGRCSWSSETGENIVLRDTAFHILSEFEAKMVQKICLDKIIELNIGIDLNMFTDGKSNKRRLLTKKRAMTTSFFDIGKKDLTDNNISLFGNSLEGCVLNDKKREMLYLSSTSERGSRNSIVSLFRVGTSSIGGGVKSSVNSHKLNENVRSCESLPTGSGDPVDNEVTKAKTISENISNYFGNITKSAYRSISRSQSDIRRDSQDNSEFRGLIQDQIFNELQVPKFVTCCIRYLEENGLHKVGIFRVSTSKKKIKQLRDTFDKYIDKSFEDGTCPHNVATLLKEFLRDLPEPLLSNGLYNAFLETQKIRNRRLQLEATSHLVKLLPPIHRDTLYVLLKFLAKVAACSDDISNNDGSIHLTGNKMDSNNLATVFAPNILRSTVNYKSSGHQLQTNKEQASISDAINVIRIMIDHYEELFKVPAEVLDIVYSQLQDEAPEQLNNICEYHKTTMHNFIQFY